MKAPALPNPASPLTAFLAAGALLAAVPQTAIAQDADATASHTLTYEVREIREISIAGGTARLVVNTATAGMGLDDAMDEETTWAVTTNLSGQKVTGRLDEDMPPGLTLRIELAAPEGAASVGPVALTPEPSDLVTGVGNVHAEGLRVVYTLSATVEAGVVPEETRTVTFTIVDAL